MPLSGCLSTAIDHLHLHNFACQSILPRLHCQTLSWVDSLEHRHLYISTCQQVLAQLHCQNRNRRCSLDNFYPSNMKPWTEDIRLTTFTCTTSLAKQRVHNSSANLELHTTTWSHALAQLHLPTNTRTPPMGNLELKTSTWQFSPLNLHKFSSCQKTHNFGMRHPAAYSPWQPHMEDVHLQTFPWHSSLWFIYWKTCEVTKKNIKQPETSHVPSASIYSWPFTCSHSLAFLSFIFQNHQTFHLICFTWQAVDMRQHCYILLWWKPKKGICQCLSSKKQIFWVKYVSHLKKFYMLFTEIP